jgi:hypothetical protein
VGDLPVPDIRSSRRVRIWRITHLRDYELTFWTTLGHARGPRQGACGQGAAPDVFQWQVQGVPGMMQGSFINFLICTAAVYGMNGSTGTCAMGVAWGMSVALRIKVQIKSQYSVFSYNVGDSISEKSPCILSRTPLTRQRQTSSNKFVNIYGACFRDAVCLKHGK